MVLHSWPWPTGPWKRIHIDHPGSFMGTMFLMVVDAYSKWLEVLPMSNTTTDALRTLFGQHGLPKKSVFDNGPQLTASKFTACMVTNAIDHIKKMPHTTLPQMGSGKACPGFQGVSQSRMPRPRNIVAKDIAVSANVQNHNSHYYRGSPQPNNF